MLRTAFPILTALILLLTSAVACSRINTPTSDNPTPTPVPPTATPTPTPSPTPTATPTPAISARATPAPKVKLGAITDFMARLNGLSLEGSFKMGEELVTFAYRPDQVDVDEAGLRVNGTLSYDFQERANKLAELGALLMPIGDTCDKIGLTTDPVVLPQFDVTIPGQRIELDLTVLDGTDASVPAEMVCQATRLVTEQADSLLTKLLISQINQLLKP